MMHLWHNKGITKYPLVYLVNSYLWEMYVIDQITL